MAAPRTRGRPREPNLDQRILDTAMRLMGQSGYARMSVDAVAAEAGVTKPTIYLRYPSKAALATAALAAHRERDAPRPTGDTCADLVAILRHFKAGVERPYGMNMLGTVLAEEHETPGLLALYREQVVAPRRRMLRDVLDAARGRGELAPDVDSEDAANALVGSYYARYLTGSPVPDDWPERTVGLVLHGILAPTVTSE